MEGLLALVLLRIGTDIRVQRRLARDWGWRCPCRVRSATREDLAGLALRMMAQIFVIVSFGGRTEAVVLAWWCNGGAHSGR